MTRFTFQLHPVGPDVAFAVVFHDGEGDATERVLRFFRDYCEAAPDTVNPIAVCGIIPADEELFPHETHGRRFVMLGALFVGPVDEGEQVLRPLRTFAPPLVDFSGVQPYVDAQKLWDADYPDGMRYYWKSVNLSRWTDETIARIAEHARRQPSPLSTTDIWPVGGAMKRNGAEGSAFRGREAVALLSLEGNWVDRADDEANMQWVRSFIADMDGDSDGSRYLNFAGFQEEGEAMMRKSFGPHFERLLTLKRRYDPTNLFHLNQNIDPT